MADFMPILDKDQVSRIVRRVKVVQGEITFELKCHPRFDYARMDPTAEQRERCIFFKPSLTHLALISAASFLDRTLRGDSMYRSTLQPFIAKKLPLIALILAVSLNVTARTMNASNPVGDKMAMRYPLRGL